MLFLKFDIHDYGYRSILSNQPGIHAMPSMWSTALLVINKLKFTAECIQLHTSTGTGVYNSALPKEVHVEIRSFHKHYTGFCGLIN